MVTENINMSETNPYQDNYSDLYKAAENAYTRLKKSEVQKKTNELWKEIKSKSNNDLSLRHQYTHEEIKKLKELQTRNKAASINYFAQVSILSAKIVKIV